MTPAMLLLDTHIWLWLMNGDDRIKKSGFIPVIHRAVKASALKISSISLWETAMLSARGKITLAEGALLWIRKALAAPGITVCPLTPEIAVESTQLPGKFRGDPADMIIVASARVLNATLVTFDKQILAYAAGGYVKTLKSSDYWHHKEGL
jgi:PIN domain nuclease of toxin-antitoxin system